MNFSFNLENASSFPPPPPGAAGSVTLLGGTAATVVAGGAARASWWLSLTIVTPVEAAVGKTTKKTTNKEHVYIMKTRATANWEHAYIMKKDLIPIKDEIGRISLGAHAYWVNMTVSMHCFVFFIQYLLEQREKSLAGLISARIILVLSVPLQSHWILNCWNWKLRILIKLTEIYLLLFNSESKGTKGN